MVVDPTFIKMIIDYIGELDIKEMSEKNREKLYQVLNILDAVT